MGCGFVWANYRVLFHWCAVADPENVDPDGKPYEYYGQCEDRCKMDGQKEKLRGPGMTECPKCAGIYVEWTNFKKWLE